MKKVTTCRIVSSVKGFALLLFLMSFFIANSIEAQPQLVYSPLIRNLSFPVAITSANDGSNRLFIVEQGGLIKIYKNGAVLSKPFIDLTNIVQVSDLKGLWSIAFTPNFAVSRTFFVYYIDNNGATTLARFKVSNANPDSAILNSGVVLFSLPGGATGGPKFGDLHFGNEGYLYLTVSDGSNPSRTTKFAQDGKTLFGKMLRLNVNVTDAPYYSIPPDNPYANNPNMRGEIWLRGFRNAWRWSFDRQNGNMWIADVGGEQWEEINVKMPVQQAGINYGWPCYEGTDALVTAGSCSSDTSNYAAPVFKYPHDNAIGGSTIIGGYVYRGNAYPALKGYYICSDYASSNAWKIKPNGSGILTDLQSAVPAGIVGYGEDESAELYAVSLQGTVYRVQATGTVAAVATTVNNAVGNKNLISFVYPTLVDNSMVVLDLKEVYKSVRLLDINGLQIMQKSLDGQAGKIILNLPRLSPGMYIVELLGKDILQQKIYVTK